MLLIVRAKQLNDPLYEAYCEYEQLKIFVKMNLIYGKSLFIGPI